MKKRLITIPVVVSFCISACGRKLKEAQVSAVIKIAFQKQYSNTPASWEKEKGNYEVKFKKDDKTMSSVIDKNGTIVETETDIAVSELPSSVQAYAKEHYKVAKIQEAA